MCHPECYWPMHNARPLSKRKNSTCDVISDTLLNASPRLSPKKLIRDLNLLETKPGCRPQDGRVHI